MTLSTFLSFFLFLFLIPRTRSANPVTIPILQDAATVQTRVFALLPPEKNGPAAIISIKPFPASRDLAVCTLTRIYRVKQDGSYTLFLDVEASFQVVTGRMLNYNNKAHGGVRSVAFHPGFSSNGRFYISAMEDRPTNPSDFHYISDVSNPIAADSVLVEYRIRNGVADPLSYRLLFRVGMPVFDHPIKQIEFYKGLLYIAHGDGSVQSAIAGGGQNKDALGKILRINPIARNGFPYTIPQGNPWPNGGFMVPEVFAFGFRNPHHICFSNSGVLFVADAGRDNVEEVNIVKRGRNYGWALREGTFVHLPSGGLINGIQPLPANDAENGFEYPVAQVGHEGNIGAGFVGQAIAGGCPIENGSGMSGRYWYADFPVTGKLYFSELQEMFQARTRGKPQLLRQAQTKQANVLFGGVVYDSLGAAFRSVAGNGGKTRLDVRFGRGSLGELYWSSKRDGRIYLFESSMP